MRRRAIAYALLSAALFGASTPLAKIFVGSIPPACSISAAASGLPPGCYCAAR